MKQNIKYSYCVDNENNLVHINSISKATRHSRKWYCLQCGQEMVANLGNKKSWYFSHKADTACDGESYLHKLAKRRIKEKFDNSNSFPIEFVREVPCHEAEHCLFVDEFHCHSGKHITIKRDLKSWDNNSIYDTCSPEVVIDEFRPDLLLTNSLKPNREPVFIEIYKTHKSEEEKIKSNHQVIETKKIKSEEDINDIIKYGFIEGQNCEMYNFKLKPSYPYYIGSNPPVDRFIIYKSGLTYIISAMDYELNCVDLNRRHDSRSVAELNIGINNYLSIILVVVLFIYIAWYYSARQKGKRGETRVSTILSQLPYEYMVLNDLVFRTEIGTTQIDQVVVSKYGIFAIETKNYRGDIYGNDNSKEWTQVIVTVVRYIKKWWKTYTYVTKNHFYNPVRQSVGHAIRLKKMLYAFPYINIVPIVVFTGDAIVSNIENRYHVVYEDYLLDVINEYRTIYLNDDVQTILGILTRNNVREMVNDRQHVKNLRTTARFVNASISSGICPKCGGNLVEKNGKYGIFYGCSNYPKCRFTTK